MKEPVGVTGPTQSGWGLMCKRHPVVMKVMMSGWGGGSQGDDTRQGRATFPPATRPGVG